MEALFERERERNGRTVSKKYIEREREIETEKRAPNTDSGISIIRTIILTNVAIFVLVLVDGG